MKPFVRIQIETYRRPQPTNQWEDQEDNDDDVEVRVCDALLSVYDIQLVTDVNTEDRIAVMLTDGSLVSVVSTLEKFTELLKEYEK